MTGLPTRERKDNRAKRHHEMQFGWNRPVPRAPIQYLVEVGSGFFIHT